MQGSGSFQSPISVSLLVSIAWDSAQSDRVGNNLVIGIVPTSSVLQRVVAVIHKSFEKIVMYAVSAVMGPDGQERIGSKQFSIWPAQFARRKRPIRRTWSRIFAEDASYLAFLVRVATQPRAPRCVYVSDIGRLWSKMPRKFIYGSKASNASGSRPRIARIWLWCCLASILMKKSSVGAFLGIYYSVHRNAEKVNLFRLPLR